jgi:hypothetical protein
MIVITLTKATPDDFPKIAALVSAVVTARVVEGIPYQKENDYFVTFVLNRGNDWFASFIVQGDVTELRITYRYENDGNVKAFEGLQDFLEWKLTKHFSF